MKSSYRRRFANWSNAWHSTGPTSCEGKRIVARNAIKHGLLCQNTVLPKEDFAAFKEHREQLRRLLDPRGPLEILLFERVVANSWRLTRAARVESGLLFPTRNDTKHLSNIELANSYIENCNLCDALGKLSRYENSLERGLHKALAELMKLQQAREGEADEPDDFDPLAPITMEAEPISEKLRNKANSGASEERINFYDEKGTDFTKSPEGRIASSEEGVVLSNPGGG